MKEVGYWYKNIKWVIFEYLIEEMGIKDDLRICYVLCIFCNGEFLIEG